MYQINCVYMSFRISFSVPEPYSRSPKVHTYLSFLLSECGFMEELLHSPPREHAKYTLQL